MSELRRAFENPIRMFALVCVAATSGFFAYLAIWLIKIVTSPDWCAKAIQAERITPGNTFQGLTGCIEILKMQVATAGKALIIVIGTFALCLGVLMVIVVAGARLAGKLFGNEIDIDQLGQPRAPLTPAAKAANETAAAAVTKATEIGAETAPPKLPGD
jgi:hypothetical protein